MIFQSTTLNSSKTPKLVTHHCIDFLTYRRFLTLNFTDARASIRSRRMSDVFYVDRPTSTKKGPRLLGNAPRKDNSVASPVMESERVSVHEVDPNTVNTRNRKSENEPNIPVQNRLHSFLVEEAGVSGTQAQHLAQNVVRRSIRPESVENMTNFENLNEILADSIKNTLINGPVADNRDYIEKEMVQLLTDEVKQDTVNADTNNKIGIILEKARVPNELRYKIKQELYDNAKKMSERVKDLKSKQKNSPKTTAPERDDYKYRCYKEIDNFLTPITVDISDQEKQKQKNNIKDTVAKLKEILMNTSSHDEQMNQMLPVLLNLIQKNPLTIDTSEEELANDLLQKLEKIPLMTSNTPRQSTQSQEIEEAGLAESEYTTKIENEIEKWLSVLPIDQSIIKNSNFIKDLAGNIVDRQKYYQLHPTIKPSAKEQSEHLNYEVFRLLNKLLEPKDLDESMSSIDELMNAIKTIHAPLIVGGRSTYTGALANEVAAYIDKIPPEYLGVDKSKLRKAIKELVDTIDEIKDKSDADSKISEAILTWLPQIFPEVPRTELNKMVKQLLQILKEKGFTDDTWILALDPSKFLEENLNSALVDWLKSIPLYLSKPQQEKKEMENAVNVLGNGLKQEIKHALNSGALGDLDIDPVLLKEINKHLDNLIRDPRLINDSNFVHETAEIILDYLKDQQMFQNISQRTTRPGEYLEAVVANWVLSIPVQGNNAIEEKQLEDAEREFTYRLKKARLQCHPNSPQHEKYVKEEVKRFLQSIIIDSCIRFDENFLNDRAEDFVRVLKVVPIDQMKPSEVPCPERKDVSRTFKSPSDVLYENVANWCQDLPIYCGDSPDDIEKVQSIKQNLSCKLINKIGALNLNPDIFKDDYLYEQILLDELDIMLKEVPKNSDFVKYLPALKRHLVAKVKEARQTIRNELEAMNYKHQLREAVDTTLHFPGGMTSEELASFEVFKETISEAFINYLYSPDDDNAMSGFTKKISDDVDKLCNDYVRRHGLGCCYDTVKIKADIYKLLQSINVPSDESMRTEVEQLKIKNVIYNWLKQIPFRDDSAAGKLNRNKVTSILAKRIHEIEKEKESNPFYDSYSNILDEIVKYLKKMPLVPGAEQEIQNLADRLKNTLQTSARNRILDTQKCLNSIYSKSPCRYSSNLTSAEREHLHRIKERTGKLLFCKDACLGPPPIDECSQTDIRPSQSQNRNHNKSMGIQCSSSCAPTTNPSRLPDRITPKSPCYVLPPQITTNLSSHACPNTKSFVSTASSPLCRSPPCASSTRYSCMAPGPSSPRHSSYTQQESSVAPGPSSPGHSSYTQQDSSMNRVSAEISPNVNIKEYAWGETYPSESVPASVNPQVGAQNRTTTKSPGVPLFESVESCRCGPSHRPNIDLKPCTISEPSSGDETRPGPSYMGKPRVINLESFNDPPQPSYPYCASRAKPRRAKSKRNPRSNDSLPTVDGHRPEYYETCYKHRGNPCSERREERTKCSCKERVFMSYKENPNILREHCQRCGAFCPYPTNLYFKE